MASIKNSNRKKRKYTAERKAATERNREARRARAARHEAKKIDRTMALLDQDVRYGGTKQYPHVGRVVAILRPDDESYPKEVNGSWLRIQTDEDVEILRPRKNVRPI